MKSEAGRKLLKAALLKRVTVGPLRDRCWRLGVRIPRSCVVMKGVRSCRSTWRSRGSWAEMSPMG